MIIAPYRHDLRQIVLLNPKGGCGKTTLATNLASYFALHGPPPTLIDNDPRGFTARWLEKRPPHNGRIHGIASSMSAVHGRPRWPLRIPKESCTVIIDTPAALDRREIAELTYNADCILIPVLPSAFDVRCVTKFVAELLLLTQFDRPIAVVANRTRLNTNSLAMLVGFLTELEIPTIGVLRNSQNYVHAADLGLGICELPQHKARRDVEQLGIIISWLDRLLARTWEPGPTLPFNTLPTPFARPTSQHSQAG